MVPIVQSQVQAWPQKVPIEAKDCQERIQCLEKALGFMQAELDRLHQNTSNTDSSDDKYDKITVWPPNMVQIMDWVNGNWRPKPQPRSDSFRAKSVAPTGFFSGASAVKLNPNGGVVPDHRATSAPPAPPRPFPRR